MARIRCDIEPDGLRAVKLITSRQEDNKIEPFRFFLKVQPAIKRFRQDINRVLRNNK